MHKIEDFAFKTDFDRRFAQACLDNGKNLLFACCVDYPGLYKIPMYLYEGVRRELKELGYLFGYPKRRDDRRPRVQLFFQGPRPARAGHYGYRPCSTARKDATGFKVFFIISGV